MTDGQRFQICAAGGLLVVAVNGPLWAVFACIAGALFFQRQVANEYTRR